MQAGLIFLFSIGNDWLSILWHKYREESRAFMGALVAVALGAIAWLTIIWVGWESHWLLVPDVVGTAVGSYYGIRKHYTSEEVIKTTPAGVALKYYGFYKRSSHAKKEA